MVVGLVAGGLAAPAAASPDHARNSPPNATTGPDRTVTGHPGPLSACPGCSARSVVADLTLDGSASVDPDGDRLRYRWRVVESPEGGQVHLTDERDPTARATVEGAGQYVFSLTVTDGSGASDTALVSVRVVEPDGADRRGIVPSVGVPVPVPVPVAPSPFPIDPSGECTVTIPEDADCGEDRGARSQDPDGNDTVPVPDEGVETPDRPDEDGGGVETPNPPDEDDERANSTTDRPDADDHTLDETRSADAIASGVARYVNERRVAIRSYANRHLGSGVDKTNYDVVGMTFTDAEGRTATRYVVAEVDDSTFTSLRVVRRTDRSPDVCLTLNANASRTARATIDRLYGEFVSANEPLTASDRRRLIVEYGSRIDLDWAGC